MKATGIVRRIDDLGRVVIPKEIRRTLRIKEGDPLEIFTNNNGEVIFKKYSPIGELSEFATQYADTLARTSGQGVLITDKDSIIAVSGLPKKDLSDKKISPELEAVMEEKTTFIKNPNDTKMVPVAEGNDKYSASVVAPIITEGDYIGSVIVIGADENYTTTEVETKLAQSAAGFLGKYMES